MGKWSGGKRYTASSKQSGINELKRKKQNVKKAKSSRKGSPSKIVLLGNSELWTQKGKKAKNSRKTYNFLLGNHVL